MFNLLPIQLHETAMGLHHLHEREIIHGDLKGVRPSPLIPFHTQEFVAQHLNHQRNTSSSLSCRLWPFDPHPECTWREVHDHRWWYAPLHGPRAVESGQVRRKE